MSEKSFSLIDLKSLSEPATKLIETVSSGVGILYEPTRMRRRAKAEADVAAILARGNEEVQDINLRAAERLANKELRRQGNIESIVVQAIDALPNEVSDESVSEDFVAQFFSYSQDVGDAQMQAVWAKILAGEVAKPSSFSPRTMHLVRHLRQTEAAQFRIFCSCVFEETVSFRSHDSDEYLKTLGLTTVAIKNLESIGLVNTDLSYSYSFFESGVSFDYFGQSYHIKALLNENMISSYRASLYLLTQEGRELAPIVGAKADMKYIRLLTDELKREHLQFELES